jgi:hypothetical protein
MGCTQPVCAILLQSRGCSCISPLALYANLRLVHRGAKSAVQLAEWPKWQRHLVSSRVPLPSRPCRAASWDQPLPKAGLYTSPHDRAVGLIGLDPASA